MSIGGIGDDIFAMVVGSGSRVEFVTIVSVSCISVTTISVNSLFSVDKFVNSEKLVPSKLVVVPVFPGISSTVVPHFLKLSPFSDKKSKIRGKLGGGGGSGGGW